MIEMKKFENAKEMKRALYALKLFGITAEAYYAGERTCNSDMKVKGIGAELSPEEYKKVLMERAEQASLSKQEEISMKREALKQVPHWMERASKFMDAEKLSKFLEYTMNSIDGRFMGQDVADALDVAEFVSGNTGKNSDVLRYMQTKTTPYLTLANIITNYFYDGFYTSMEAVRGVQYNKK